MKILLITKDGLEVGQDMFIRPGQAIPTEWRRAIVSTRRAVSRDFPTYGLGFEFEYRVYKYCGTMNGEDPVYEEQ